MKFDKKKDALEHLKILAEGDLGATNYRIEDDGMEVKLYIESKKTAYFKWMVDSGVTSKIVEDKMDLIRKAVHEGGYWVQYITRDGGRTWRKANG